MVSNVRMTITPEQVKQNCIDSGNPNPTNKDVESFYRFCEVFEVDADTAKEAHEKVLASMDIAIANNSLAFAAKLLYYPPIESVED